MQIAEGNLGRTLFRRFMSILGLNYTILNMSYCITGSYKEARKKLRVAEVLSNINIPSDAGAVNLERGKTPRGLEIHIHQEIQVKVRRNQHFLVLHQIFWGNSHGVILRHMISLFKHILSFTILLKGFLPTNLPSNALSSPSNNITNNSSIYWTWAVRWLWPHSTSNFPWPYRPGSSASIVRPGSSASIVRTVSPAFIVQLESSASIDRRDQSIALDRQQWTLASVEQSSLATNGSYAHHSQPETYSHLSQFVHHVLPSLSLVRGYPFCIVLFFNLI